MVCAPEKTVTECYLLPCVVSCCALKQENVMRSSKTALSTLYQLYKKASLKCVHPFGQYHPFCHCNGEKLLSPARYVTVCEQCKICPKLRQCMLVKQEEV